MQYYRWVVHGTQSQRILFPGRNRTTILQWLVSTIILKNLFPRKQSQSTQVWSACFCGLIDWTFVVLCVWLWSEIKREQPVTVTINKKPEILCQNKTNLINHIECKKEDFLSLYSYQVLISWWPLNI